MTVRKTRKDSVENAQAALKQLQEGIPFPAGVHFDDAEALALWDQFTRARIAADWRAVDLLMVAKLVKCELDIRQYELELDAVGPVVETPRGGVALNPLFSAVDMLQRKQIAIIKCLSLTINANSEGNAEKANAKGKQLAADAAALDKLKNAPRGSGVVSLLAGVGRTGT